MGKKVAEKYQRSKSDVSFLKELVGRKAKIRFDEEFLTMYEYTILAVDEE
ncbi:hypothetical protein ACA346_06560 [Streptococcus parasuis]